MLQFNYIANQYFQNFYGYKLYLSRLWMYLIVCLITTIAFSVGIYFFLLMSTPWLQVEDQKLLSYFRTEIISFLFVSELSALVSWGMLDNAKYKLILLDFGRKSIQQVHTHWLKSYFQSDASDFVEIAEKFQKGNEIYGELVGKTSISSGQRVKQFLFDKEAKNRIYGLLAALFSLIGLISINDKIREGGIGLVLTFFGITSIEAYLLWCILISAILLGVFILCRFISQIIFVITFHISSLLKGSFEENKKAQMILIRDLYKYHRNKKRKVLVRAGDLPIYGKGLD
jgi:hypothetical protein